MGAGFAFRHETAVRLRDLDGLGHVNNAAIVTYLEDARTLYLLGRRGKSSIADFDFILARTEIDYRAPAFLHERLEILVKPKRIGSKSFELEYRVNSLDTVNSLNSVNSLNKGRLVAEALTVLVAYDFARGASCPVPADLRTLLEWDLQLGGA
jgi:acyl-CoA thioester hydrolase